MHPIAKIIALICLAAAGACRAAPSMAFGPRAESRYLYGTPAAEITLAQAARIAAGKRVVFFGEQHDDPATHRAELAFLAAVGDRNPNLVLSLEMFERDVQGPLDDYLAGRLSEADFLAKSRPWERYQTDYRALVELARAHGWPVVASNVPRRIASLVSRRGLAGIDSLTQADRPFVARDLSCPRDRYFDRFAASMSNHGPGTQGAQADTAAMRALVQRFYEAQCVKDETMAESIVQALESAPTGATLVHFNGAFHSDYGLGTADRVLRRLPGGSSLVVSSHPVTDVNAAPPDSVRQRAALLILAPRVAKPPTP